MKNNKLFKTDRKQVLALFTNYLYWWKITRTFFSTIANQLNCSKVQHWPNVYTQNCSKTRWFNIAIFLLQFIYLNKMSTASKLIEFLVVFYCFCVGVHFMTWRTFCPFASFLFDTMTFDGLILLLTQCLFVLANQCNDKLILKIQIF